MRTLSALALFVLPVIAAAYPPKWACPSTHFGKPVAQATVGLHAKTLDMKGSLRRKELPQYVTAVGDKELTELVDKKEQDILIVFYAPWCPHCQQFVMQDEKKNATNAPLERLNTMLIEAKGPKVVKFDVTASQPEGFEIEYVPMIYLLKKDGDMQVYKSDPSDLAALKSWATGVPPAVANSTVVLASVAKH